MNKNIKYCIYPIIIWSPLYQKDVDSWRWLKRLRELDAFSLEKEHPGMETFITMFQYLKGVYREGGDLPFY